MALLKDKIALITGANRGIGTGILRALAQAGAEVIGTSTRPEGVQAIEDVLQEHQWKGMGLVLNVNEPDQIQQAIERLRSLRKMPHFLINNAGITRDQLLMRQPETEWNEVLQTNLTSIFRLTKACLKDMMKYKEGRIVNIGSVIAHTGNPGQTAYSAAKAGLEGLTRSLALEVAPFGVTANVIAPGFIQTDMTDRLADQYKQQVLSKIPLKRMGTVDDIGQCCAFLCSPAAGYITGQILHVNGGMFLGS